MQWTKWVGPGEALAGCCPAPALVVATLTTLPTCHVSAAAAQRPGSSDDGASDAYLGLLHSVEDFKARLRAVRWAVPAASEGCAAGGGSTWKRRGCRQGLHRMSPPSDKRPHHVHAQVYGFHSMSRVCFLLLVSDPAGRPESGQELRAVR